MKNKIILTIMAFSTLALTGCGSISGQGNAVNKAEETYFSEKPTVQIAEFKKQYAAADVERKKAAKLGMEWNITGKLLKKAKKLASSEKRADLNKAIKMVKKAKKQGIDAQNQATIKEILPF